VKTTLSTIRLGVDFLIWWDPSRAQGLAMRRRELVGWTGLFTTKRAGGTRPARARAAGLSPAEDVLKCGILATLAAVGRVLGGISRGHTTFDAFQRLLRVVINRRAFGFRGQKENVGDFMMCVAHKF
jgi:hypothetical protein